MKGTSGCFGRSDTTRARFRRAALRPIVASFPGQAKVLSLSTAERSRLLERLIASLDVDPEIEEGWVGEAEKREAELVSGAVVPVPGEQALARLRARFK